MAGFLKLYVVSTKGSTGLIVNFTRGHGSWMVNWYVVIAVVAPTWP